MTFHASPRLGLDGNAIVDRSRTRWARFENAQLSYDDFFNLQE